MTNQSERSARGQNHPSCILGSKCCNQVCNEDPAMLLNLISICSSLTSASLWNVPTVCHQTPPYLGPHRLCSSCTSRSRGLYSWAYLSRLQITWYFFGILNIGSFSLSPYIFTGAPDMLGQLMLNIGAFSPVQVCTSLAVTSVTRWPLVKHPDMDFTQFC